MFLSTEYKFNITKIYKISKIYVEYIHKYIDFNL